MSAFNALQYVLLKQWRSAYFYRATRNKCNNKTFFLYQTALFSIYLASMNKLFLFDKTPSSVLFLDFKQWWVAKSDSKYSKKKCRPCRHLYFWGNLLKKYSTKREDTEICIMKQNLILYIQTTLLMSNLVINIKTGIANVLFSR